MNQTPFPEQAVAGSLLIDARSIQAVRPLVKAGDFSVPHCAAIYRAVCRLSDTGGIIDPVTIQRDAVAHGDNLSEEYLLQLMELTPTAANAAEYAKAVRDHAVRRAVRDTADTILERAGDETVSTASLVSGALEQLQRIDTGATNALISSEDAAVDFLDYRERLESGRSTAVLPTGFAKLDMLLGGGMVNSGLYILAARPGIGKTTVGLKVADRVSKQAPALFVSLEMDSEQLTARRLADRTGIRIGKILMESCLTDEEQAKIAAASSDMAATKLYINRSSGASVEDVALYAHSIPDLGLVVIDYLGLLSGKDKGSLYEKVTANSNALKRLARSLKVPVLCLAQLNRMSEQRQDKRPTMADLRDSGAIEQDADGIILLHRPTVYLPQEQKPKPWESEPIELIVAKNRHGQTGRITLDFYGSNGRIV